MRMGPPELIPVIREADIPNYTGVSDAYMGALKFLKKCKIAGLGKDVCLLQQALLTALNMFLLYRSPRSCIALLLIHERGRV
jgi:hypothetical protein